MSASWPNGPAVPAWDGREMVAALARRMARPEHVGAVGSGAALGVDLGTSSVVVVAVDAEGRPLAGVSRDAEVVRDGVVVDYIGTVNLVRELVGEVQGRFDERITRAAGAYPPGICVDDAGYVRHVIEACELEVVALIEEPIAANLVVGLDNGAVVDVGGGTTGTAVFRNGAPVYTADDPTGGHHLSLVLAGGLKVDLARAEQLKRDPEQQRQLFRMVVPVFERVAAVIAKHLRGHEVEIVCLNGGTCAWTGMDRVVQGYLGIPVTTMEHPMLVTPLGIARAAALSGQR